MLIAIIVSLLSFRIEIKVILMCLTVMLLLLLPLDKVIQMSEKILEKKFWTFWKIEENKKTSKKNDSDKEQTEEEQTEQTKSSGG